MRALRAGWEYFILAFGLLVFALFTFLWGVASLALLVALPAATGRRVGRRGAMWGFRSYLVFMEAVGAFRLELEEVDALRDAGPLIIAPNHPSLIDAVLVVSRLPNALCVMKGSLLSNFLLGPAARLARYVPNDSLIRLVSRTGEELRLGGQLVIFPEGTRTVVGGPIGPCTDAVGALSRRLGVPVQALLIEGDARFLGKGRSLLARPNLPLEYRVSLGRRFEPPADARAFTAELQAYFARELTARAAARERAREPEPVEDVQHLRG